MAQDACLSGVNHIGVTVRDLGGILVQFEEPGEAEAIMDRYRNRTS